MTDECPICKNDEEPCAKCRRQIHESWHAIGCWWIRPEECHPGCPGYKPTVDCHACAKECDGAELENVTADPVDEV